MINLEQAERGGLNSYIKKEGKSGLSDLLIEDRPLAELLFPVRKNLYYLPGGDLLKADRYIATEMATPNALLETAMNKQQHAFDVIIIDCAGNSKSHLAMNAFYWADAMLVAVGLREKGMDALGDFMDRQLPLMINRMRQSVGKEPIQIVNIIPNWHDRRTSGSSKQLEKLKKRHRELVSEPLTKVEAIEWAWKAKGAQNNKLDTSSAVG